MKNILLILFLILSLSACSIFQSSEEEEKQAKADAEEVYVFDEVDDSKNKTNKVDEVKKEVETTFDDDDSEKDEYFKSNQHGFFLQLGAFSTKDRAEQFLNENKSKVPFSLSIVFNSTNSLYTVRSSAYQTKPEAQMVREGLWNQNMFKDAFIVSE
ncbi:MAG: SPOR domain-containing protein [Ignavibacteriae bacterium]|nr:SPOR domain-containing protein [Ignavibacteriota bacterium]